MVTIHKIIYSKLFQNIDRLLSRQGEAEAEATLRVCKYTEISISSPFKQNTEGSKENMSSIPF